jgi:hypothetical protein
MIFFFFNNEKHIYTHTFIFTHILYIYIYTHTRIHTHYRHKYIRIHTYILLILRKLLKNPTLYWMYRILQGQNLSGTLPPDLTGLPSLQLM